MSMTDILNIVFTLSRQNGWIDSDPIGLSRWGQVQLCSITCLRSLAQFFPNSFPNYSFQASRLHGLLERFVNQGLIFAPASSFKTKSEDCLDRQVSMRMIMRMQFNGINYYANPL